MHQTCIFDLDGTLINSLTDLALSSNYALEALGFPTHKIEEYRYFVGRGVAKLIEAIIPEPSRTAEVLKKARALFDEHYGTHYSDNTLPYDGIPELLSQLRQKGVKLAVVSNKPDVFVKKIVAQLFGGNYFDAVIGQQDGVPRKPDPAAVFTACRSMGVEPQDCCYIGDSGVDMLTAKASGAFAVGVLWGFRGREELLENGAQALAAHPRDLLTLI
jgi:phosphoglycolate phosphatase